MHIIGHRKERETLLQGVREKNIAQAYLFHGPRGIGKSLCAREFASLLANEPDFEPTEEKPHPFDVLVLRPVEETKRGVTKTKNIPAEDVRAALSFLSSFPVSGDFRVVIIEDAHKLSDTAQNVLLKTLEEPQSTAVIILVTHEIGSILPTVLSRVKRVHFDFVSEEDMKEGMKEYSQGGLDIAPFFYSLGRPGMIRRALADPVSFEEEKEKLSLLFRLSTLSVSERLALAEKLALKSDLTIRLLEWWLPGLYNQAMKTKEKNTTVQFFTLLENTEKTVSLLKTTQSNPRLLLEKLFFTV